MGISVTLNTEASEALKKIVDKDKKKRTRDELASVYVIKGANRQATLDKWNKAHAGEKKPATKKPAASGKEKKAAPSKKKAKAGKKAKKEKHEAVAIDLDDVTPLPEKGEETVSISD